MEYIAQFLDVRFFDLDLIRELLHRSLQLLTCALRVSTCFTLHCRQWRFETTILRKVRKGKYLASRSASSCRSFCSKSSFWRASFSSESLLLSSSAFDICSCSWTIRLCWSPDPGPDRSDIAVTKVRINANSDTISNLTIRSRQFRFVFDEAFS